MIVSNLYETNSRVTHPDTEGTIVDEFTRRAYEIGEDKIDSYYLGWIKKGTLPSNCLCSSLTVDGEQDSRTFTWENITDDDNFPCGYIGGDIERANQFNTTISRRLQYINQLYPEYSCEMEDISTTWNFYLYDSTGEHLLGVNNSTGITIPIKTFSKLCMGYSDASFTITIRDDSSSPSVNRHFTLTPDNLGHLMDDSDDYLEWIDEDDDQQTAHCKLRVALRGFYVPIGRRYDPRPQYEPFNAQWFVKTTCTLNNVQYDHYAYSQSPDTIYPFNDGSPYTGSDYNMYGYIFEFPFREDRLHYYADKVIQFGVHGEFTETQLASFISSQNLYIVSNNIFGYKDNISSTWAAFVPLYKLKDVFKCLCLQYRTDIDVTSYPGSYLQGYVLGRTYATDVSQEDEFLAKWKTGDITDPVFKDSLRPWQYENFQVNEFTEEDVPGPTPGPGPRPEPEPPGEEENGGDDIDLPSTLGVGATLGFITQYCLNASQIAELGGILWTSFVDPDYWKNYMFSLALDTGSFNTSALLDFFISLRVYPFPLVNIPSYSNFGQDMYIGTGTIPLHFTTNLHTINSFTEWVDAGSADIPFIFGDFRDYNQEITLYLPFCGTVQLEPADVLGGTINVKYAVDFATGACTAIAIIQTWDGHHYPIAILPGQIGADVPLSATSAGQIAARLGGDVLNIAGILVDGAKSTVGAVAPMVVGIASENPAMIAAGAAGAGSSVVSGAAQAAGQVLNMATRPGIGAPMLSGGRGFSGFGCPQKCYIQMRRPFYDKPANYDSTEGQPATVQVQVLQCSGLARFVNPDVSSIDAMEEEKEQIRRRLAQGVII